MDTSMFHWGFQAIKFIWSKLLYPPLMFTGFIFPLALSFAGFVIGWEPGIVWWIVAWALVPYTFIQNIVRKVTHDPSFKIWKWVLGKGVSTAEKKTLNPTFHKDYIADTPEGVPFGKQKDNWVRIKDDTPMHCLVIGASGAGKSQCFVMPLLLCSKVPSLVIDIKKELSEKTAKPGDLIFDPTDETAVGYNPFWFVDKEKPVGDIITMATSLIPVTPGKDAFWEEEAKDYLAAGLLYCFKHGYSFSATMQKIKSTGATKFVQEILEDGDEKVLSLAGQFDGMSETTLSGIFATVNSKISIFATDDDLIRCFSQPQEDCLTPEDLLNGKNIFLCLPEERLEKYKYATMMMVNQFLKWFEKQKNLDTREPIANFVLDEFFRIGKLESVQSGLATLQSKGVRIFAICQDNSQIEVLYGKDNAKTLFANFGCKLVLSTLEVSTQDYYSRLSGTFDRVKKSFSDNKGDFKALGSSGTSITTEEKKIIKPEEFGTLPLRNEAVLFTPYGWGKVKKQPAWCTPEYRQVRAAEKAN